MTTFNANCSHASPPKFRADSSGGLGGGDGRRRGSEVAVMAVVMVEVAVMAAAGMALVELAAAMVA